MTGTNPNLNIVNINNYVKFGSILLSCSQDIEEKRNSDIPLLQVSKKMTAYTPKIDSVNVNAYITFGDSLSIYSRY